MKRMEKREAFLVLDERIADDDLSIVNFLKKEGFSSGTYKGYNTCCPWIFIDIVNMVYCFGKSGVKFVDVIGEHAITIEEFKIIYQLCFAWL